MDRKPRKSDAKIMGNRKALEFGFVGLFMAVVPLLAARMVVTGAMGDGDCEVV
jgi:hypothetical protein